MTLGASFRLAYRDAWALLRATWPKLLIMLAAAFAAAIVGILLATLVKSAFGKALLEALVSVGTTWLIAPYVIVLYRFVLTGRVEQPPRTATTTKLFFAWSSVIGLLVSGPGLVDTLFEQISPSQPETGRPSDFIILALFFALWIFVTRIVTLLPGIAMGRAMTLRDAFAESRGHFWFIVGAILLPILPIFFGVAFAIVLVIGALGSSAAVMLPLLGLPAAIFSMLLGIAVSARLAERFGPTA